MKDRVISALKNENDLTFHCEEASPHSSNQDKNEQESSQSWNSDHRPI